MGAGSMLLPSIYICALLIGLPIEMLLVSFSWPVTGEKLKVLQPTVASVGPYSFTISISMPSSISWLKWPPSKASPPMTSFWVKYSPLASLSFECIKSMCAGVILMKS